jgi:hypothetical protein
MPAVRNGGHLTAHSASQRLRGERSRVNRYRARPRLSTSTFPYSVFITLTVALEAPRAAAAVAVVAFAAGDRATWGAVLTAAVR